MKRFVLLSALALWGIAVWSELRAASAPIPPTAGSAAAPSEAETLPVVPASVGSVRSSGVSGAHAAPKPAIDAQRKAATDEAVAPLAVDEDDVAENEEMLATDTGPEQGVRRAAWANEAQDDVWTQKVGEEVKEQAGLLLSGDLRLHHLSCHETVCRMYLQFANHTDAVAFMSAPHEAASHYDYQRLDPQFEGGDYPKSDLEYEVLITRPRPDGMTEAHSSPEGSAPPPVAVAVNLPSAVNANGEAPVQLEAGEVVFTAVPRATRSR
jgi:hypothetical protein